jgi:hypothetical protein
MSRDPAPFNSNPFEAPGNLQGNHQGQPVHGNATSHEHGTQRQKFQSTLPSVLSTSLGRSLTEFRKSASQLEDDKACSEWETIAPGDELAERAVDSSEGEHVRTLELVFHAQEILPSARSNNSLGLRRNTILGPVDTSSQRLPWGRSKQNFSAAEQSFCSSSSFYSDLEGGGDFFESEADLGHGENRRRPATLHIGRNTLVEPTMWRRFSKASSSTSGDPFKYDAATYSAFLQPAAEREVSSALHRIGVSDESIHTTRPLQADQAISLKNQLAGHSSFYNSEAIRST